MTEPTPATTITAKATGASTRKTPAKKAAPAKPEFAPTVAENGRLNHAGCGHPRDLKGRAACRANHAKATEAK
ncbi:hypothetical protein SAMN05443287_106186 [Micromonospora phaseoli]|uniref:Uncharacterized protein n=1 Tax=Micromonospora phaseoli TaxID=1144548 RepID=A0A1H7AJY4_9ACTN|nr:hypothetical protein [Micromonospora phaseoli]PZV96324.1 hypothetical protein CLV64_107202 [Micromonospora phaseoli]GIJ76010.1 hypothetical protein Xph01_04420 [Micromonospora phaseoli]SEJ65909.1 hypothetical protein SAMN05443287_106186 [Micromonospora phaseoli]